MDKKHIVIIGPIGVGKTILARGLSENLGVVFEKEDKETEELKKFYKDPKTNAYWFQIFKGCGRYKHHKKITEYCFNSGKGAVQDEGFFEDKIFAKTQLIQGYITEDQYKAYLEMNKIFISCLEGPDVIIYLRATADECMERIKKRGRDYEKSIEMSYIKTLCMCYDEEVKEIARIIPVIDVNNAKFVTPEEIIKGKYRPIFDQFYGPFNQNRGQKLVDTYP